MSASFSYNMVGKLHSSLESDLCKGSLTGVERRSGLGRDEQGEPELAAQAQQLATELGVDNPELFVL